jgi:hypothetical protein
MSKSQSQNFQLKLSGLGERTLEGVAGGKHKKNNFGIERGMGMGMGVDRRDEVKQGVGRGLTHKRAQTANLGAKRLTVKDL